MLQAYEILYLFSVRDFPKKIYEHLYPAVELSAERAQKPTEVDHRLGSCNTLQVPSCHATRRKQEGWDTARLPKPRQGKSNGRGRVRTTDLPNSPIVHPNAEIISSADAPTLELLEGPFV
ncbi:hypothetical protein T265_03911 [Opisthorchis viverrini]|uniref:Uncharacterized protein n=1 Tax=Opisthorchis viverrini TaxID=6198 RepID=A0A075A1K9_OPIVI|nr:hypothetical protein T265_03911 [Opisthorchis viverrini]KER29445.1 hypothetical protein T265_03911 [Opisthorchis viverrini]